MPRPSVVIDPDQQRPVLPLRVPISADIEFCARALAIEYGRPNRKLGKHRVRTAALALADRLIHEQYVPDRSEEHTSELQSRENLVCRLLLEKKQTPTRTHT